VRRFIEVLTNQIRYGVVVDDGSWCDEVGERRKKGKKIDDDVSFGFCRFVWAASQV
jgi:hypothetical protein